MLFHREVPAGKLFCCCGQNGSCKRCLRACGRIRQVVARDTAFAAGRQRVRRVDNAKKVYGCLTRRRDAPNQIDDIDTLKCAVQRHEQDSEHGQQYPSKIRLTWRLGRDAKSSAWLNAMRANPALESEPRNTVSRARPCR